MSLFANTLRIIGRMPELDRLAGLSTLSDRELERRGTTRADLRHRLTEIIAGR